jgi:hypothetical protein
MSWAKLLGRHVTAEPTSKAELDNLRSIVTRSLEDAVAAGLSADARFVMAYDAARTLSLILVRSEGYRPKRSEGITTHFWPYKQPMRPLRRYRPTLIAVG